MFFRKASKIKGQETMLGLMQTRYTNTMLEIIDNLKETKRLLNSKEHWKTKQSKAKNRVDNLIEYCKERAKGN